MSRKKTTTAAAWDFSQWLPDWQKLQALATQSADKMPMGFMPLQPGSWIAPTFSAEELEKRIAELKTVQFWLENNGKLVAATIQALQVQKMTLSTLEGMHIPLRNMTALFGAGGSAQMDGMGVGQATISPQRRKTAYAQAQLGKSKSKSTASSREHIDPTGARKAGVRVSTGKAAEQASSAVMPTLVDAAAWWNQLTQQFGEIAQQVAQQGAPMNQSAPAKKAAQTKPKKAREAAPKARVANTAGVRRRTSP